MTEAQTPTQKILRNSLDGKEIKDSKGRKICLKNMDILDRYDLTSALGDDANKQACLNQALPILYIAAIDGFVIQAPKSFAEFRMALKLIGDEGIEALGDYFSSLLETSNKVGGIDEAKK